MTTRADVIERILATDRVLRPAQIGELRAAELAAFALNPNSLVGMLLANIRIELLKLDRREIPETVEAEW